MAYRVFVVGDILIDRDVEGEVTHVAPDFPTPVLVHHKTTDRPGGMWNVALNVQATDTVEVTSWGVVGLDNAWQHIHPEPNDDFRVWKEEARTTQIKTRFIGQHGHRLFRLDTQKDGPVGTDIVDWVISGMAEVSSAPDAILVADYGCGMVTRELIERLFMEFSEVWLVIDPYPTTDPLVYDGADVLVPNAAEFKILNANSRYCHAPRMVVTNGSYPTDYYRRITNPPAGVVRTEIPVPTRQLVDPCGAGDAFVAYLTASIASRMEFEDAIEIANHAGACAVSHPGVYVVSREEVDASMRRGPKA